MDKELFDELIQSCKEAVAYENGDKSMARFIPANIPDTDISFKYNMLIETDKAEITAIIDKMLLAYR